MFRKVCKWVVFKCIYPVVYFFSSKRPVDEKKYVFVENHQEYLSDNFHLLYKKLIDSGQSVSVHYLKVYQGDWKDIIIRSVQLLWNVGDASCVFLAESNSLFGSFTLRKETQLVQLWHACGAFKKWGRSVSDKTFGESAKELEHYDGHHNYTMVPVSAAKVVPVYEEAFGIEGRQVVQPIGVSRTDVYYDSNRRQIAGKLVREKFSWIGDRRIILYAPTFRGDIKNAGMPKALDYDLLQRQLGRQYVILVKNHPFIKEEFSVEDSLGEFVAEVKEEIPMADLMMGSDICITDYSSVIFEYALLEKPMLFYAYDVSEYYDERGFYYPYETFVPGKIVKTTEELVQGILHLDQKDIDKVKEFREQYMSGCDGHATSRILSEINKYKEDMKNGK